MRPRDVRVYLFDIRRSAEAIQGFARDKSLDDYLGDLMPRSAVERQFEIVGEALAQACAGKRDSPRRSGRRARSSACETVSSVGTGTSTT